MKKVYEEGIALLGALTVCAVMLAIMGANKVRNMEIFANSEAEAGIKAISKRQRLTRWRKIGCHHSYNHRNNQ